MLYMSKEKFNAERLAGTRGYTRTHSIVSNNSTNIMFFSGIPSTVTSSNRNMSPMDQHQMLEYTNSLEAALKTA
jgi:hypothetical protein